MRGAPLAAAAPRQGRDLAMPRASKPSGPASLVRRKRGWRDGAQNRRPKYAAFLVSAGRPPAVRRARIWAKTQAPSAAPQAAFGAAGSTRASVSDTWWRLFVVSCVRFRRLAGRVRPSGDGPGAVSAVRTLSSSRPSADRTREPRRVVLPDSRCDRSHEFVVCDLTPVRGFRGENEVVETRSLESEANHTVVGLWLGAMPL